MAINYMTVTDVEDKTKTLIGKSVNDIIDIQETTISDYAKGKIGQIVERDFFGLALNNSSKPDFDNLDLELKVTGYKWVYKGSKVSAKERLVLSMIDFHKDVGKTFYTTDLYKKINKMLFILYEYEVGKSQYDFIFSKYHFYDFDAISEKDRLIILNDWEKIMDKIRAGKAHEISEGDTFYLGACTKGADGKSHVPQPFNPEVEAMSRAYSFKTTYMTNILRKEVFNEVQSRESLIKDLEKLKTHSLEDLIYEFFDPFIGYTLDDLDKLSDVKINREGKQYLRSYASLMMRVDRKNIDKLEEFEKANISIKTIRINKEQSIREDMSFPAFDFQDFILESWENSSTRDMFMSKKLLFVIFEEIDDNSRQYRFKGTLLWNVPFNIIEDEIRIVWEKTYQILTNSLKLNIKNNRIYNNFPSSKENKYSHIRPHGQNRKDTNPLPKEAKLIVESTDESANIEDIYQGHNFTKQCFWLNKSYIVEVLKANGFLK